MVHPKVKGYHVVNVKTKPELDAADEQAFIGRIEGKYHLLGYRPLEFKYLFSENECASLDLGIVELPDGKRSLSDLVKGDAIRITNEGRSYEMIYDRFA
jgi:hypothetical protein